MEPVDMDISSATEEEDDDDDDEFNKLLNSLSGMEECLVPLHDESNDGAVTEHRKENKAYNENKAEGNQTETLEKTEEGSKQHNCIEISDVNLTTVSPISSNASTLSRESTPRRNCQTDCDNEAQRPTLEVSTAQLSDNDVILDSINKCHKNLDTGSGSDHSDICFLGIGTANVDGSITKSKQTSTLPDNCELNSKSIDSAIFDGAVTCSPKNATTEHHITPLVQTQPQESENATPSKLNDSDSDCLIVEHIAASDHRLNGLIDLTKAENDEDVVLPLEKRSEESLLKEISQIREALMKHSTKTHKKNKKHKRHKSHSSSKKKKKRSKSRTESEVSEEFKSWTKSPSLEKISDDEDDIADESRLIMVTENGKLSVDISNLRSKRDSGESDDSSKTESTDKETAVTAKSSKSTESESIDSTATAKSTVIQNVDSSTTQCTKKKNVDSSAATQPVEIETADSTETTKLKQKVNLVSNCNEISINEENASEVNKAKMLELSKLGKPADKADSGGSPRNSDGEILTHSSEKLNITRTDNSKLTRSDFDDNPLRRKLSYNPDQNDIAKKTRQKAVSCESGKELKSKFRRTGTPKSYRGRGSKKESFAPPGDIGSHPSRKLNGSDSEPERPQQSAPSADRFNRFMSDSDSEKSINSAISKKSKSIGHYDDVNWETSGVYSVSEFDYCRGRSMSIVKSPPSYSFQRSRRSPSPLQNVYRSLSRSPTRYRSRNISSYRSPSLTYRNMSRRSRTPSITRELYYRASLSRSRSPNERLFRSKSRGVRSPSHPRSQRSPSRHRRRSYAYRSPSMFSRSPSYTRWSKSRAYRSPPRSRRSKSRTYRSPPRLRRSKSRTYRSPSRSHRSKSRTYRSKSRSPRSKSRRCRSKSRRNSPASRSNSTRSPSIIRAARACSPLEDMRQQLKKNNEAAVQQALGGLEKPTKGRANLKACKARVIDDVDLTTSPPSPETSMSTKIKALSKKARTASASTQATPMHSNNATVSSRNHNIVYNLPLTGFGPQLQPVQMQNPGYIPMPYSMMHNPGMMNQMGMIQIGHVFSQAAGPPERSLGPPDRPLGPPDRPLGPQDRSLGPPDRPLGPPDGPLQSPGEPLGPSNAPLGPPDRPLGSSNRAVGPPDRPLGLSNRTLGPPERPLGPPEGPSGPPRRGLASPECYMPLHFYLHPPYL